MRIEMQRRTSLSDESPDTEVRRYEGKIRRYGAEVRCYTLIVLQGCIPLRVIRR